MANYPTDMDDLIEGTPNGDVLRGLGGNDDIRGLGGDDFLIGGSGDDLLDGGAGSGDWAMYHDGGRVTVDLGDGSAMRGDEMDSLTNIENIWGSKFSDVITGDGSANKLVGGEGHDVVMGGGGDDRVEGNAGDDRVMGGMGDDHVVGNQGNDMLWGNEGDDRLAAGKGDDVLFGGAGDDVLIGGAGADKIKGGNFQIDAMPHGPHLDAGMDTASYHSSDAGVTINLLMAEAGSYDGATDPPTRGNNSDSPVLVLDKDAGGHAVGDTLYGIENLQGSMHDDMLVGRSGAVGETGSVLSGMAGDDTLMGGNNFDEAGINSANDTLMGGAGDDVLIGNQGEDVLVGGGGADKIKGGTFNPDAATPTFENADNSTASYASSDAGVTIDLSEATAAAEVDNSNAPVLELDEKAGGHAVDDTLYGIENLTGSMMGDMLTGDSGNNVLKGMDGNDVIGGGGGNDDIDGGKGDDMIVGHMASGADMVSAIDGSDTLMGGEGMDTVDFSEVDSGTASVTLTDAMAIERVMAGEVATTANGEAVTKFGLELMGGDGADTLTGGSMADTIDGGGGNDSLTGGGGDDMIMGGDGEDTILAGAGDDTVMTGDDGGTASGGTGADTITGGDGADVLHGEVVNGESTMDGADHLMGGEGNDQLNGHAGDDMLMGGDDDDAIDGGAGDDMITGGEGDDNLTGGAGADTFVYNMGDGDDTIVGLTFDNFGNAEDLIDISSLGLSQTQVTAMINEADFTSPNDPIVFDLSKANEDLEGMITIDHDGLNAAQALDVFGFGS